MKSNATQKSTVAVMALAILAGAGNWDRSLSAHVHELAGHTVLVSARKLTVVAPTGSRLEVGL